MPRYITYTHQNFIMTNSQGPLTLTDLSTPVFSADVNQNIKSTSIHKYLLSLHKDQVISREKENEPRKKNLLEKPLPKYIQDKINRKVAYEETCNELGRWMPIVSQNRRAEHLQFPLSDNNQHYGSDLKNVSNTSLVSHFVPSTDLEMQIDSILYNETDNNESTSLPDNKLSHQQIKENLIQMQKMRSFLFSQEQKLKRQAQIKSKAYRRIKKQERLKLEQQLGIDESKLALERAKERMTLRHKNIQKYLDSGNDSIQIQKMNIENDITEPNIKSGLFKMKFMQNNSNIQEQNSSESETERDEYAPEKRSFGKDDEGNPWITQEQVKVTFNTAPLSDSLPSVKQPLTLDRDLVQQAFADDKAMMKEFEKEKKRIIREDASKKIDISLPGWGEWSGHGINERTRKITKIEKGIVEPKNRKDAKISHVIMYEGKIKAHQRYKLDKIPHPFETKEQYEATQRMPIGKEWQSISTFKSHIQPRIQTKPGCIISPVQLPKRYE